LRSPLEPGLDSRARRSLNEQADKEGITPAAIEWGYKILLGRLPEADEVREWSHRGGSIGALRGQLWTSEEFKKEFRLRLIGLNTEIGCGHEEADEQTIIWAYMFLLVRIPDRDEVAGKLGCDTLARLRDVLMTSAEFKSKYSRVKPPWQ